MPFFLILAGIALIVTGSKGRQSDLYGLILGDFTGPGNVFTVAAALVAVGSIGYVKTLRPISGGLLVLILLSMVLNNKGALASFTNQLNAALAKPRENPAPNVANAAPPPEQVVKIDTGKTPINVTIAGGGGSSSGIPGLSDLPFNPTDLLAFL